VRNVSDIDVFCAIRLLLTVSVPGCTISVPVSVPVSIPVSVSVAATTGQSGYSGCPSCRQHLSTGHLIVFKTVSRWSLAHMRILSVPIGV
jgi:hypothetical protein